MLPILISTPHCSGQIPYWILARMLKTGESETALRRRIFREGDPFTDEIFHLPDAEIILNAPASRFVADLNRDRSEQGENGVIKLTDFERRPFYPTGYSVSAEEREIRLSQYYDPYHLALKKYLTGGRIQFFIDGHSMMAHGPAIGPDQGHTRPAICIANFGDEDGERKAGPLSCPADMAQRLCDKMGELLKDLINESSLSTGIKLNEPFSGGAILEKYSAAPFSIPGIMIEVNRALYLNEDSLTPIPGRVDRIAKALGKLATFAMNDPALKGG